jgi:hypothetical protein
MTLSSYSDLKHFLEFFQLAALERFAVNFVDALFKAVFAVGLVITMSCDKNKFGQKLDLKRLI